jgi:hypothetical protein
MSHAKFVTQPRDSCIPKQRIEGAASLLDLTRGGHRKSQLSR